MLEEGVLMPYLFNGRTVRVFMYDHKIWFVLGDVGKALGISNIRELARKILMTDELIHVSKHYDEDCRAWKALVMNPDKLKKHCTNIAVVNESGLYTLIMRSTKPEAVKFRHWVTGEVIPEIMRTGQYTYKGHADTPALPPVRGVVEMETSEVAIADDGLTTQDRMTISLNVMTREGSLSAVMSFRKGTEMSRISKWREDVAELVDRLQNKA